MASTAQRTPTKTIVVLGGAYGGNRASRIISNSLPKGWRVVVIDRNTHFNHVYAFPRYTVLAQHAPKGFIPTANRLNPISPEHDNVASFLASHPPSPPLTPSSSTEDLKAQAGFVAREEINASVVRLDAHSVTITRPSVGKHSVPAEEGQAQTGPKYHFDGPEETIEFDYCLYALGASLPDPCNVWKEHPNLPKEIVHDHMEHGLGSKKNGVRWMEEKAESFKKADSILVVGGGALGIQFAGDIKHVHPSKKVTLLHSRVQLMPIYPREMHNIIVEKLTALGVKVILGERVTEWPNEPEYLNGKTKRVVTNKGTVLEADIVLPCTGQKPHSQYMAELCPSAISPVNGRIMISPTMQIAPDSSKSTRVLSQSSDLSIHTPPRTPPSSSRTSSLDRSSSISDDHEDLSHVFAVGDCADAGTIQAGHTAYYQGEVAARNILRLIEREEGRKSEDLEEYVRSHPAIKVTLGLIDGVISNKEGVKLNSEGEEDLNSRCIWPSLQAEDLPDDA